MKERPRGARAASPYLRVARRIAEDLGTPPDDLFSPPEETDLESLMQLGMPESVLAFYREFAPIETIEFNDVRLWDLSHLLEENHTYSPGAEVHELGYIVVAGNRAGDVFCLDLGEGRDDEPPRVVLLPHRVQLGARDRSVVEGQAQAVSESFDDFLLAWAKGELPH